MLALAKQVISLNKYSLVSVNLQSVEADITSHFRSAIPREYTAPV